MGYRLNPTVAHLMAQFRQNRSPGYQATLAMINAHEEPDAFTRHSTIPYYVQGCRRRARQLGYQLDEFWLHEPDMPVPRWLSIFRARNIRGILIVGMMQHNRLPARLAPLWDEFPAVVTGVRTREPALSFACSDQHALALGSLRKSRGAGIPQAGAGARRRDRRTRSKAASPPVSSPPRAGWCRCRNGPSRFTKSPPPALTARCFPSGWKKTSRT